MVIEFHSLRVADVSAETEDSVAITFDVPDELRDEFRHVPGQHLVLRAYLNGEEVRRSYSICTAPGEALRVGIKRIPEGVFSTFATTALAVGDLVEAMAPIGDFIAEPRPGQCAHHVMVAAGSGITPILSMMATLLRDEPGSQVTLVYGNRTSQTIMFHEELEALKNRHPGRFQVIHVLSRESHQVPLFEGRIDADKLRSLATTLLDVDSVDGWYLCGPLEMVEGLSATLGELGVDPERIHSELFFDERIETVPDGLEPGKGLVEVEVTIDGRTSIVNVDPDGPPLLDYARSVRAEVPFACKGGMCATCKAVVNEGNVTMTKNYALTQEEIDSGFVLTCQAHPDPDSKVSITYDVHGTMGR